MTTHTVGEFAAALVMVLSAGNWYWAMSGRATSRPLDAELVKWTDRLAAVAVSLLLVGFSLTMFQGGGSAAPLSAVFMSMLLNGWAQERARRPRARRHEAVDTKDLST